MNEALPIPEMPPSDAQRYLEWMRTVYPDVAAVAARSGLPEEAAAWGER